MSCRVIRTKNGATVLANVRPGAKLTKRDLQTLEEYAAFCHERAAARQRERNAELLPGARLNPED